MNSPSRPNRRGPRAKKKYQDPDSPTDTSEIDATPINMQDMNVNKFMAFSHSSGSDQSHISPECHNRLQDNIKGKINDNDNMRSHRLVSNDSDCSCETNNNAHAKTTTKYASSKSNQPQGSRGDRCQKSYSKKLKLLNLNLSSVLLALVLIVSKFGVHAGEEESHFARILQGKSSRYTEIRPLHLHIQ